MQRMVSSLRQLRRQESVCAEPEFHWLEAPRRRDFGREPQSQPRGCLSGPVPGASASSAQLARRLSTGKTSGSPVKPAKCHICVQETYAMAAIACYFSPKKALPTASEPILMSTRYLPGFREDA